MTEPDNICKHAFYFDKNDCWYCDMSMLPIDENCKFDCFTSKTDKIDRAWELREYLEGSNIIE